MFFFVYKEEKVNYLLLICLQILTYRRIESVPHNYCKQIEKNIQRSLKQTILVNKVLSRKESLRTNVS